MDLLAEGKRLTKNNEINELRAQLRVSKTLVEELMVSSNEFREENKYLRQKLLSLESEMSLLRDQKCSITVDSEIAQSTNSRFQRAMVLLASENSRLRQEIQNLEKELASSELQRKSDTESLQRESSATMDLLIASQQSNAELEGTVAELREKMWEQKQLTDGMTATLKSIPALKCQLQDAKQETDQASSEISKLQSDYAELHKLYFEAQSKLDIAKSLVSLYRSDQNALLAVMLAEGLQVPHLHTT